MDASFLSFFLNSFNPPVLPLFPTATLNRGMAVTILYRMSGSTLRRAPVGFTDVVSGTYYYYAVGWAQYYGVVNGVTTTSFAPTHGVTNEQILTMLHRYATEYCGRTYQTYKNFATNLADYSSIMSYSRTAVNWALNAGIVMPTSGSFYPQSYVSRQVCAQHIFRFLTMVAGSAKSFLMRSPAEYTTIKIEELLSNMGYTTILGYDLTTYAMEFALYNSSVLFTNFHGAPDRIQLKNGYLYDTDIDQGKMSGMKLVYVSACQAGQKFVPALYYNGLSKCAVGFKGDILYNTGYDGINAFNLRVFQYISYGYNVGQAIKMTVATQTDPPCGEEYIVIWGNSSTVLK